MPETVTELVEACLEGDEAAFSRLVVRYQDQVYGLCWRMLRHHQDAEDAAQDTFLRALGSLHRWDRARPFRPWLLAIAANRCRTMLSRRNRYHHRPLVADDVGYETDGLQRARQLAEEVARCLDELRGEHTEAFRLFHEHEIGYAEISRLMGRPLGTVKTWVHRARREIAARLVARGAIEGDCDAVRRFRKTAQRVAG